MYIRNMKNDPIASFYRRCEEEHYNHRKLPERCNQIWLIANLNRIAIENTLQPHLKRVI